MEKNDFIEWDKIKPNKSMNIVLEFVDGSTCLAYYFTNFDGKGNPGFAIPQDYRFKKKVYWKPNN